jgi:endoglucanase
VWFKIEWMLKMQDPATGGVYHKVTCKRFPALNIMPQQETAKLVLSPISPTATGGFAATMAMAARFYPEHSGTLIAAAEHAWEWLTANPEAPGFTNPRGVRTGEYGDRNSDDERFWAATELFLATGNEAYHGFIKSAELTTGLGWQRVGTFGLIAYIFHSGGSADAELLQNMKDTLLSHAEGIYERYTNDPYGVSLGTNYYWGSNMSVANNALTLLLAGFIDETLKIDYDKAALDHMHYLLGKNALSQSYVTGFGSNPARYPHHRPSVAIGETVPGMVVGGPNRNHSNDPKLQETRSGFPPMMSYIDHIDSYASNEITIYWNSPMYMAAAMLGF